jgi:hypothetical protein
VENAGSESKGSRVLAVTLLEKRRSSLKFLERLRRQNETLTPEPVHLTADLSRSGVRDVNEIIKNVPIGWIQQGRIAKADIARARTYEANPWRLTEKLGAKIREADLALAATTPVLGQYAPTFGWPDDWGWYWEYADAYLFVPEVAYAIKLKTRQVWKPGFEFEATSDQLIQKLQKEWDRRKIFQSLFEATKNALIWGNSYIESVDDSVAEWDEGTPADVAQGAPTAYSPGGNPNITYAPRPLRDFTPASRFYGLKNTDPRTCRIQIHPQMWDTEKATIKIEKVIQRRWSGPLAPTAILGSETELDFHPEQMLILQFNKITGGIYGYSTFRETLFCLKGYLVMLEMLPGIVARRADTTVHFRHGGDRFTENGKQVTTVPTEEEIRYTKTMIESRAATEDIHTDQFVESKPLYQGATGTERIELLLQYYKERTLMGLGIPLTVATLGGGQEIKWGTLNFELMEDETRENQQKEEDLINDYVIPRLLLNLSPGRQLGDGPEVEMRLNVD